VFYVVILSVCQEEYGKILCCVDSASRYNRKRETSLMHNLFLVYFVKLYMFRAYLCPSSGGTTGCIQHLVFIILFRWVSVVLDGYPSKTSCASSWFFFTQEYGKVNWKSCTSLSCHVFASASFASSVHFFQYS